MGLSLADRKLAGAELVVSTVWKRPAPSGVYKKGHDMPKMPSTSKGTVGSDVDRRSALGALTAVIAGGVSFGQSSARNELPQTKDGLIVRENEPRNLESPPAALQTFITPTNGFYVRNHFRQPQIVANTWKCVVEGEVNRPFDLSYRDLTAMPSRTQVSMLECAGNGRVYLIPKEPGVQWQSGAAGNAEWLGVPLQDVLSRAGLKDSAVDVVFEGSDQGEIKDEPKSPGEIHFARSLPITRARNGNVLLAYKMNGADLTPAHGFPVRAIVPGWYGMASVKWLSRIIVTPKPFDGFFQTLQYTHWERMNGIPTLKAVTELNVKSAIYSPALNEELAVNVPFIVRGMAWSGDSNVSQVEFSSDNGKSWSKAQLTGNSVKHAWRAWEYPWTPKTRGTIKLMARATDFLGRTQPMERDKDRRSYEISHVVPVEVSVR